MSLSKTIIFGNDIAVSKMLQQGVELDVIDEYGYTPLIQAAIMNSLSIAKLLLQAGAQVDFPDLTNRTALHWAISNDNYDIAELLLFNGANANAYSNGGQPVLAMPILRKQNKLIKLLCSYGANMDFAQDFISAKLLGHRFELVGRTDIVDAENTFIEVELEGFYLEFSLAMVAASLTDFRNNFSGKHLRKYFPYLDVIIKHLNNATELIKYQHYLYLLNINKYEQHIDELLDHDFLIIPVSFDGHAITLCKVDDLLIRCDRGEFGREHGTIIVYKMPHAQTITKAMIKQLLYKRQSRDFVNYGLVRQLSLEKVSELPIAPQKTGNCSWANVEAIVPILLALFVKSQKDAIRFYNEWLEWDRSRELYFCLQSFVEANPARRAAKAALLATILFQYCRYDNPKDLRKARRILQILTIPEYDYILKSYFKVFDKDERDENMQNLRGFLNVLGISFI